jgi:hypothetical protein
MRRLFGGDARVALCYVALAPLATFPMLLSLESLVPGRGVDEPALVWSLWWVRHSLLELGQSPLDCNYLFYPLGANLAAFTATFLNGLLSIPLQAVFSLTVTSNLMACLVLVLSGYGAFLLAREVLTRQGVRSDLAAAVAGAFYAFGAWHVTYLAAGQYNLASSQWLPFYVVCLLRLERTSWRNAGLAGLLLAATAWTELTFASFLAIFTVLYLAWVLWRATLGGARLPSASPPPAGGLGDLARHFLVLVLVAALGVSPLVASLFRDFARYGYYLAPGTEYAGFFSAEPLSFFVPSSLNPWLGNWIGALSPPNTSYAFVGFTALVLAALGFFWRRTPEGRFWVIASALFAVLMLGPALILSGQSTGVPLPFALLQGVPLLNANRYPVRFNTMLMLSLSPLIALGVARIGQARIGRGLAAAACGLLALEQVIVPLPLASTAVPAIYQEIRNETGDFAILDLPLGWRNSVAIQGQIDYESQYFQVVHQKRLLSGQTSRNPAFKNQYFLEQPIINSIIALESGQAVDSERRELDRAAAPAVIRFFGLRYVQVRRDRTDAALLAYAREVLPMEEVYRDGRYTIYRLRSTPPRQGSIDPGTESASLYFDDSWGRSQRQDQGGAFRWASRSPAILWLPLAPTDYRLTFALAGALPRQRVTLSVNDKTMTTLAVTDAWASYVADVPAAVLRDGLATISLECEPTPLGAASRGDYAVGETGTVSPVDISVTGAGYLAGGFAQVYVAGRGVVSPTRGYHLVSVNPLSGQVERVGWFDTFADAAESERLARFVDELPSGQIVAGAASDEVSLRMKDQGLEALRRLGVSARPGFRDGHAFVGVKGASPGQAVEQTDRRLPANVWVGKNVAAAQVTVALGEVSFEPQPR